MPALPPVSIEKAPADRSDCAALFQLQGVVSVKETGFPEQAICSDDADAEEHEIGPARYGKSVLDFFLPEKGVPDGAVSDNHGSRDEKGFGAELLAQHHGQHAVVTSFDGPQSSPDLHKAQAGCIERLQIADHMVHAMAPGHSHDFMLTDNVPEVAGTHFAHLIWVRFVAVRIHGDHDGLFEAKALCQFDLFLRQCNSRVLDRNRDKPSLARLFEYPADLEAAEPQVVGDLFLGLLFPVVEVANFENVSF